MATDDAVDQRRESDRTLASRTWELLWSRKVPLWAAAGIIVVFSVRPWACDYADRYPDTLDFKWYGEHCGPGYGDPDRKPVDELDEACRRHDEAYQKARETPDFHENR